MDETYDKEEYKKMKQQQRTDAYNTIDTTTKKVKDNIDDLIQYLEVKSKFPKYSVNNVMLIKATMPEATKIKTKKDWEKAGFRVLNFNKSITILEPTGVITQSEKKLTYYNPKTEYDISQTSSKEIIKTNTYDDRLLLKAFLNKCPIDVKTTDNIDSGRYAELNTEDKVIYIKKDSPATILFPQLLEELAKLEYDGRNEKVENFQYICTSYVLCKRYGISLDYFKPELLSASIKELELNDFRDGLFNSHEAINKINQRIEESLGIGNEEKNKKQERIK